MSTGTRPLGRWLDHECVIRISGFTHGKEAQPLTCCREDGADWRRVTGWQEVTRDSASASPSPNFTLCFLIAMKWVAFLQKNPPLCYFCLGANQRLKPLKTVSHNKPLFPYIASIRILHLSYKKTAKTIVKDIGKNGWRTETLVCWSQIKRQKKHEKIHHPEKNSAAAKQGKCHWPWALHKPNLSRSHEQAKWGLVSK